MKKHQNSSVYRFILRNSQIPDELAVGQSWALDHQEEEEIFFQLTRVFRCQEGLNLTLLNPSSTASSFQFDFVVQRIEKKRLQLLLNAKTEVKEKFDYQLELALGLPNKPFKLDFALQKATELTTSTIHLISMDRSQLVHQLKPERMNKILIEAAEQTERVSLPQIILHENLNSFLKHLEEQQKIQNLLVAMERSEEISQNLLEIKIPDNPIVLIGPEGGISPAEISLLEQKQVPSFNLGGTILRNETACVLSLGILALRLQS